MPRAPRVHLEGVIYYVTLKGPRDRAIFQDQHDYDQYLKLLNQYKAEYRFKLFSYALLPDRIHLLIEVSEDFPISQIMQRITPTYTKYFNERNQTKGSLFPRRFRSVVVEKEPHLAALTRFVHLIPVKAGLAKTLEEYANTGLSAFIGEYVVCAEARETLECLKTSGCDVSYTQYLHRADGKELKRFEQKLLRGSIYGSDEFKARIKRRIKEESEKSQAPTQDDRGELVGTGAGVGAGAAMRAMSMMRKAAVPLVGLFAVAVGISAFSLYLNQMSLKQAGMEANSTIGMADVEVDQTVFKQTPARSLPPKLPDLDGTVWEIELVAIAPDGTEKTIKDKIKFVGPAFESYYFSSQGFKTSNYSVRVQANGTVTWETIQSNPKGETIAWRGDWSGNTMEGVMSYRSGQIPRDFSFMSRHLVGGQK